jgi:hypothetical protein
MTSPFPKDGPAVYFGFHDVHGFKDYVGYVILSAPDQFDWNADPGEEMDLDRAFVGLRYGFDVAAKEKGESRALEECRKLVEEALEDYRKGREREGVHRLQQMDALLLQI